MTPGSASWCPPTPPGGEPRGREPEDRGVSVSALCSRGWTPLLVEGLLRDLLTRHFAAPLGIGDLGHLVWSPAERTGILIESFYRWLPNLVEKRPAIILRRNAMHNLRLGIGDAAGATLQGVLEFTTFWLGSHSVYCIHGAGAAAEILALEVQRQLTEFGHLVTQYLKLGQWVVTEVGGVQILEESKQSYVVPITVGWAYAESWALEPDALPLAGVALSAILNGALLDPAA